MLVAVKRILISLLTMAMLVISIGLAASWWLLQQPLSNLQHGQLLEISRGANAGTTVRLLARENLLKFPRLAYYSSRIWVNPAHLKAGVYQLEPGLTLRSFWQRLEQGQQHQFQITLIEGQTWRQWQQQLQQHPYLQGRSQQLNENELLKAIAGPAATYLSLEGLLMPDTFSYQAYSDDLTLLRQAHQKLLAELQLQWQQRADNLPYKNPYELLIMASIIEKETGMDGERALVSSVFVNRLNANMRLQSDPTTIYGIDDFDGNLTRVHLRQETPYNTYRIAGLPPTPIAMVSRASLAAAAQPAQSDYFYFVADGSGGHVFSQTYEQHQQAVNRYQRKQR
ncbi:endolytic transglycosylase MltG [Pseudidiomarina mangrovi]|uniref:endolytic transglycosylase MltG n=1 Tax=Pseudidiomarina mangrovi TaxID=2487133 RepID=UPI000FC9F651|nr:endolytic transglycosylase MltG [Pseudidiomarina mangrovi]